MRLLSTLLTLGTVALGLTAAPAFAQAPANDRCSAAQSVTPNGVAVSGTTVNANDDVLGLMGCQTGQTDHPDVWYTVTATGKRLTYTLTPNAATPNAPLELLVMEGACSSVLALRIADCNNGQITGEIGVNVGQTYRIVVASDGAANAAAFTLALTSTTPAIAGAQDCNLAEIIDIRTPTFQLPSTGGFGIVANEVTTSNSCFGSITGQNTVERQSKWFKFVAGSTGRLLFNIAPARGSDDYDWAVWDITSDPNGCTTKGNALACNWSGATGGTGLSLCPSQEPGYTSTAPYANTTTGQTGANAPITIQAGRVYALLVDNYTTSNLGFTLTFGGACAPPAGTPVALPALDATFRTTRQAGACNVVTLQRTAPLNPGAPPIAYRWNFGDGSPISTDVTPTHTYPLGGASVYVVTLEITDIFNSKYTKADTINLAPPVVQIAANGNTALCAGQSVSFTASGASTYVWSPATGLNTTTGATVTASPTQTTTYTITGTRAANGCTSTNTVTVTVAPPFGTRVFTTDPTTICAGQVATLRARAGVAPGATFLWSPAVGLSSTTDSVVTAAPTQTTTYTVTATRNGCTSVATQTITVAPPVTARVASTGATTFCAGNQVELRARPNAGTGPVTFLWSPAAGLSSATDSVVTASPTTTTTYTVTITRGPCSATATQIVTVDAPITARIVPDGPTTLCSGTPLVLRATGGTDYEWSPALGLSSTTGDSVVATPTVTTLYRLRATTGTCQAVDSVQVTITRPLALTAVVAAPTICAGGSTTLTASGGAGGRTIYQWSPATGLSSATDSVVTATPTQTTTYTVTATRGTCIGTQTVTVAVTALPTPAVTADQPTVCAGGTTTLRATGARYYTWAPLTGLTFTAADSSVATVSPTATTTYTLTGRNGQCPATATVTVTAVAAQQATGTIVSPVGVTPHTTAFTSTLAGATGYTWDFGDGTTSTDANPSHTYTRAGDYEVTLIATYGAVNCTTAAARIGTVSVSGVAYNIMTPNGDGLNDVLAVPVSGKAINVKVFNRWGRPVFEQQNYQQNWQGGDLPSGTYYYFVEDAAGKTWKGWVELVR